jgi:hypothetical protein
VALSCDGAMGKAPLGGEATGPNPTDREEKGRNDLSSATGVTSRSGSRSPARTSTTPSSFARASASILIERPDAGGDPARASAWTKATTPGGVRARRRARLYPAHPRARRGEESTRTGPRFPRPPLGGRAHPLLAEQSGSAAGLCAGRRSPKITALFSDSLAESSAREWQPPRPHPNSLKLRDRAAITARCWWE